MDEIEITESELYNKTIEVDIDNPAKIRGVNMKAAKIQEWLKNKTAYAVAFNQVGFNYRCFVINDGKLGLKDLTIINPTFEPCKNSKIILSPEFCLSYPGRKFMIKRHKMIKMTYYSLSSKKMITIKLHGMSAIICQHEISHLDGKTDTQIQEF